MVEGCFVVVSFAVVEGGFVVVGAFVVEGSFVDGPAVISPVALGVVCCSVGLPGVVSLPGEVVSSLSVVIASVVGLLVFSIAGGINRSSSLIVL